MLKLIDKNFSTLKTSRAPNRKVFLTFFLLFLFRFGSTIPLSGIDQEALKKAFLQMENRNAIMQLINMYAGGGGKTLLSPFSLGIIPFINASILIDLLTALFPSLEKLQSEEGEAGRRKLAFYKKILTFLFASVQSGFLIFYLQSYFYLANFSNFFVFGLELVTGSMLMVWISTLIDNKGIGNGTSLIIFINIVTTLLSKNIFSQIQVDPIISIEILFLFFFIALISISQTARMNIEVVSARQLAFLETKEKNNEKNNSLADFQLKENGLSIRLNQAGIFPIIIASNLIPLFSFVTLRFPENGKIITTAFYYLFIVSFNYFYTIIFWDPEKISEQLRKASVSIVNVTPGKPTVLYLENVVRSSSLIGGIFLCVILYLYELVKQLLNGYLLNQINISSLIILVGVAYEIQKIINSMYKNMLDLQKN